MGFCHLFQLHFSQTNLIYIFIYFLQLKSPRLRLVIGHWSLVIGHWALGIRKEVEAEKRRKEVACLTAPSRQGDRGHSRILAKASYCDFG